MLCKKCNASCIKNGFQNNGKQRYYCKLCKCHQQEMYTYNACNKFINKLIYTLLINSCGITDISRVLKISKNTVSKRILEMAKQISMPIYKEYFQSYEVDELCTKINGKQCWVSYAINRHTKQVINFALGGRTKENLARVINTILLLNPKRIYTDKLTTYRSLIPENIHNNARYQTNRIERFNLNLRTHLKRLSRKTICFSKNLTMLEATIRIYFWGHKLEFNN